MNAKELNKLKRSSKYVLQKRDTKQYYNRKIKLFGKIEHATRFSFKEVQIYGSRYYDYILVEE